MGRPSSCNPCCGEWYTTEKLTYDDGEIKRLAFTDYFYNHPMTKETIYFQGSSSNSSKTHYDDFNTWAIFTNTDGGLTIYSKDNLKEIANVGHSQYSYDENGDRTLYEFDVDAPDVLPRNRRYNENLGNRRDVDLDYGEFQEPQSSSDNSPDYPNPIERLYYRNYDNPSINNDIIWYQSILDNLESYDFESVYNAAFAALNPSYRGIPADFAWSEDNDSEYDLIEYIVSDAIYCYFRLGHENNQDQNAVNPHDSLFLFVLDFEYTVISTAHYESTVISEMKFIRKTVHKNNKLYSLVLNNAIFSAPSRNFDFVIIDLSSGLQDRFTGGVNYTKYYQTNMTFPNYNSTQTGTTYTNRQEAIDNAETIYVSSSDSIIDIPSYGQLQRINGYTVDTADGISVDVDLSNETSSSYSHSGYNFGFGSGPFNLDRFRIRLTGDSGLFVLSFGVGFSLYTALKIVKDTFFCVGRNFAQGLNATGPNNAEAPSDFDVDSDGYIYMVGFNKSVLEASNNEIGYRTLNNVNGGMRPNGTDYADVVKISGVDGSFIDSTTYHMTIAANHVIYTTNRDNYDTNSYFQTTLRANCIAITDDGIWVGGDQVWPTFGEVNHSFPEYEGVYNSVISLTGVYNVLRNNSDGTFYIVSSTPVTKGGLNLIGDPGNAFGQNSPVNRTTPCWNTDAIDVYQGGLITGANSTYRTPNFPTFPNNNPDNPFFDFVLDYNVPYNATGGDFPYIGNVYSDMVTSGGPIINNDLINYNKYLYADGQFVLNEYFNVVAGVEYTWSTSSANIGSGSTHLSVQYSSNYGSFRPLTETVSQSDLTGIQYTALDASYSYNLLLFDFDLTLKDKYYFGPSNMDYGKDSSSYMMRNYTSITDMCAIGDNVYITGGRRHDDISTSTGRDLSEVPT